RETKQDRPARNPAGAARTEGAAGLFRLGITDGNVAVEPAARRPLALDRHPAWFDDGDEVIHDPVSHRFVENAFVAETLQVHLEALQFHAVLIGNVVEDDGAVVGLTGFGAHRGKLGATMLDGKIALWAGVVEHLQQIAKRFTHVGTLQAQKDRNGKSDVSDYARHRAIAQAGRRTPHR